MMTRTPAPDLPPRRDTEMDLPLAEVCIDALGLLCPLPVLRLRKRLQELPAGTVVCLWADDPAAVIDVPHFCAEAGHALLAMDDGAPPGIRFLLRKAQT